MDKEHKPINKQKILLSLYLLALVATLGYLLLQQQKQGAAINEITKKVDRLTAQIATATPYQNTVTDITPKAGSKEDAVMNIVNTKAYEIRTNDEDIAPYIVKINDTFAYAKAGAANEPMTTYILKQINGTWTIVFYGKGSVPQKTIDTYEIPQDFLPS